MHPKTDRNRDLIEAIVAEVRSHDDLKNIAFTSIQINHNTISAPHTDNNLIGTPSIAIGLGDYSGGRLRLEGATQPLNINDRAVVFDGRKIHSSGLFNGDRWSLVLFVHSSWATTSPAMRSRLISLGMPCPPNTSSGVAVPATEGIPIVEASLPPDDEVPIDPSGGAPAAEAGVPPEAVRDPPRKGTLEEAQSQAHQMTHMPKNPFCDVCSKAKMQRK